MRENIVKIITLALIQLLGFMSYEVFIVPKAKGVKNLRETSSKIERQINAIFGEEVILRGGALQQEEIVRQLEKLSQQIPSEKDFPDIMDDIITKSTRGLDIDFKLIEPQKVVPEEKYKKLPIRLTFSCNYHAFVSYLTQLSRLPAIITVDQLNMVRGLEEPDRLEVDMTLSAFVMPLGPGEEKAGREEKTPSSLLINPFVEEKEGEIAAPKIFEKEYPTLKLQGIWKGKEIVAFITGRSSEREKRSTATG